MKTETQPRPQSTRLLTNVGAMYRARLATTTSDLKAAQALRFEVFNVELNEGLAESFASRLDADPFDEVCDHLLVENATDNSIVGTYRLQTGRMAGTNRGYYSEQEFDFGPYESVRAELVELGRACVHKAHRNLTVLGLLWKGIADYARARGARYLCGCSSLTSQDPGEGASAYAELCRNHLVEPVFRTLPRPGYECCLARLAECAPKIPKLLRAYLSVGARICGPPALDRQFKTIDFLTFLDLETLPPAVRLKFMS